MERVKTTKWINNFGAVMKKGNRTFICLGNAKDNNEANRLTVEVTVKNSKGEVIYRNENGLLNVNKVENPTTSATGTSTTARLSIGPDKD